MSKKISISDQMITNSEQEGRLEQLNKAEHIRLMEEMNNDLEEFRRDYKVKESRSIEASSKSILTV
ncbi:MAG: hypothetical protein M9901_07795 [Lentimicrobium sp.]|jgi:hypothetical protein|nr:hypothetical protein [Lentimicrobium sp.]